MKSRQDKWNNVLWKRYPAIKKKKKKKWRRGQESQRRRVKWKWTDRYWVDGVVLRCSGEICSFTIGTWEGSLLNIPSGRSVNNCCLLLIQPCVPFPFIKALRQEFSCPIWILVAFALDSRQAATSYNVPNPVFAIGAPTMIPLGRGWELCFPNLSKPIRWFKVLFEHVFEPWWFK